MQLALRNPPTFAAQPNDLDRKRIEKALQDRKRYRYVLPRVTPVSDGYRIESPCCSRNVDPEGGVIDVALFQFDSDCAAWHLFRKDHAKAAWELHSSHRRLPDLLNLLKDDPDREFWQ